MGAALAYEWTEDMAELSGFGGDYERSCRAMVKAGLEWWDLHPKAEPRFKGRRGANGLINEDNHDAQSLTAVMMDAAQGFGGPTGVMLSACLGAVFRVRQNGWEAYADELRARKLREPPRGGNGHDA